MKVLQGPGIPKIHCLVRGNKSKYNFLVMEMLSPNLQELFQRCGGRFTLKTIFMLADQMIERIEYIHNKGLLHRDLKPDNINMGIEKDTNSQLYFIDYGYSKSWMKKQGKFLPYLKNNFDHMHQLNFIF